MTMTVCAPCLYASHNVSEQDWIGLMLVAVDRFRRNSGTLKHVYWARGFINAYMISILVDFGAVTEAPDEFIAFAKLKVFLT